MSTGRKHPVQAVILAVAHESYAGMENRVLAFCKHGSAAMDVKSMFAADKVREAGVLLWRL